MQFVDPSVYLVAETNLLWPALENFLDDIGAETWRTDAETDVETLPEVAGRLCYNSFAPGLNPNVATIRSGNAPYMANILAQNHGSVLEHATCTFIFKDVSRVFTHELVRHRVGTAISQESLRYVRVTELKMYKPDCIHDDEASAWEKALEYIEQFYLSKSEKLNNEKKFSAKKLLTSALRRMLPGGICTTIMWTANMRTLRQVILQRTAEGAEEEIRKVFDIVAKIVTRRYPAIFQDFHRSPNGTWAVS